MLVKNHMSKNVITVNKNDMINKALDIMNEHDLHRLPVMDGSNMVGLLTKGMISKKGASKATSLSVFELNYLLSKIDVATIMEKQVISINENQFLEDAAVLMLKHDIGCLPVVDDNHKLCGIMTQNDLFRSFIDMLGYRTKGSRLCVKVKDGLGVLEKVCSIITEHKMNISHIGVYGEKDGWKSLIIRVDSCECDGLEGALKKEGYEILSIMCNPVE